MLELAFTLAVWWLGTALVLHLCRLPSRHHGWLLSFAALAAAAALYGIAASSTDGSAGGAYLAFVCAIAVFGALEVSYYTGALTGPRDAPCPPDCRGWRRFSLALQCSLYHELAVIGAGLLIAWLARGGENQVGVWTYAILWWMRWSAKLNLFLGVPHLYDTLLPPRLRYLSSYMARRRMNPLFPFSIVVPAAVVAALAQQPGPGAVLLATLLALAIVEHLFFLVRLPERLLWGAP